MTGRERVERAAREAIGFYWGSGLSNEVPALAWFLLASLVPLAPGQGAVLGKLRHIGVAAAVTVLVVMMVLVASAGTGVVRELGLDSVPTRIALPIVSIGLTALICGGVYWLLSRVEVRWKAALSGGLAGAVLLQVTPTAAGYYLRYVAGSTPVELFLMLSGVLITCYLAALALLIGAGVTVRVALARRLGAPRA